MILLVSGQRKNKLQLKSPEIAYKYGQAYLKSTSSQIISSNAFEVVGASEPAQDNLG